MFQLYRDKNAGKSYSQVPTTVPDNEVVLQSEVTQGSSQIIPRYGRIMAAAFNVELRARSTGNATGLVYG